MYIILSLPKYFLTPSLPTGSYLSPFSQINFQIQNNMLDLNFNYEASYQMAKCKSILIKITRPLMCFLFIMILECFGESKANRYCLSCQYQWSLHLNF